MRGMATLVPENSVCAAGTAALSCCKLFQSAAGETEEQNDDLWGCFNEDLLDVLSGGFREAADLEVFNVVCWKATYVGIATEDTFFG